MSDDRLVYLFDPLCGWCYGAGPGLDRIEAAGLALEMIPTGLFADTGRMMDAEFAQYAWSNDQRIGQMTGVPFTETYRRDVLNSGGPFDSGLATLAVVAAGAPDSRERRRALKALQAARYVDGRDLTDRDSVIAILAEAGLPDAAEALRTVSDELMQRAHAEILQGQSLMQGLRARGVPTLAQARADGLMSLPSELLFDRDADLGAALG